jgi:hypothetical protein
VATYYGDAIPSLSSRRHTAKKLSVRQDLTRNIGRLGDVPLTGDDSEASALRMPSGFEWMSLSLGRFLATTNLAALAAATLDEVATT